MSHWRAVQPRRRAITAEECLIGAYLMGVAWGFILGLLVANI